MKPARTEFGVKKMRNVGARGARPWDLEKKRNAPNLQRQFCEAQDPIKAKFQF